jgi:phosphoribosylformimino-5-aminoimidazole carboxamide ribotide isomerase
VKQIVGSSLRDEKSVDEEKPETNFETDVKSSEFAEMYKRDNIYGGHAILLSKDLETKEAALEATRAFPGGLQIGGGVTAETALEYLENGASHVIVTSYVFHDGKLDEERLEKLIRIIGKKRLVLDLSCRRDEKDGNKYKVVTDRWQKWTDVCVDEKTLERLSEKCDEFLVHGVDVEGKKTGFGFRFSGVVGEILPNSSHLRRRGEIDRGFRARENVRTESSGRDHRFRLGLFRREFEVRGRD